MRSTFHGLETARRGLATQQTALQTTGHNIANANTVGYSRQRVNFTQTEPYPAPSINRPQIPGQLGTGVEASSIQRVREGYLDLQFRGENSKLGDWESRSQGLGRLEDLLNEPSEYGLSKTLDRFWQSLQDLANSPENNGARSSVRQRGLELSNTFNYFTDSINKFHQDTQAEEIATIDTVNYLAGQINKLNEEIGNVEPHGYLPNDLYDQRDVLIDQLSKLAEVSITVVKSQGNSLPMAEGKYTIELVGLNNTKHKLVDGTDKNFTNPIDNTFQSNSGKLKGLSEAELSFTNMLTQIKKMSSDFVTSFNSVHNKGFGIEDSNNNVPSGIDFFIIDGNGRMDITNEIKDANEGLNNIAASIDGFPGDGNWAISLSNELTLPKSEYEKIIGSLGVRAQEAERMVYNSGVLLQSVEKNRHSVSGVSLDEEMTNMIQFQHAYNASARTITSIDEMLDRIINNMGIVGR
jgi:flagellar hook-associated protein 1